jgi:ribosomal protein S11
MQNIFFINDLWIKFLQKVYLKKKKNIFLYLKFWIYIKKYIYFIFFLIYIQNFKYKNIFFALLQLQKKSELKYFFQKNNNNIQQKYIQKGYKINKLGIYIKNLERNLENYKVLNLAYYFLIRFKRKNLFLTLLNNEGNVLCKTNIGSCGFKKKVKSTGYAIKWTSKIFLEKITKSLINNIYNTYYIKKKKKKKKKIIVKFADFITNKNNLKLKEKQNYYNKIRLLKKRKKIKTNNIIKKKKNIIIINKKKKINLFFKNFKLCYYRNYYEYFKLFLKNKLKIIFRIKSNLKFWGYRFITYSLAKSFFWFRNLEIRLPIPHSTSLRLKKKRRI